MPKRHDNKPWERQLNESTQAFGAFKAYLDMGDERSYAKVGQRLGKSKAIIDRWGSTWKWQERIREYDNFIQAEADKKLAKAERQRRIRLGSVSDQFMYKALQALEKIEPAKLSAQELMTMMRMAVMLNDKHRTVLPKEVGDRETESLLGALLLAFEAEDGEYDK